MIKKESVIIINMSVTATLGLLLLVLMGGMTGDVTLKIGLTAGVLLYPIAYFITKAFLKLNIIKRFKSFYVGGFMSVGGTLLALFPSCLIFVIPEVLKYRSSNNESDMFAIMDSVLIVVGIISFIAFIIGAVAGLVITNLRNNEEKMVNEE